MNSTEMRNVTGLRSRTVLYGALTGALVLGWAASPLAAQLTPPNTMPRQARGPAQPASGAGLYRDLARGFSPLMGNNPVVTEESYGLRNAIVTGNVFGGRGFRGSVGYAGEHDFRGATGSELVDNFMARTGGLPQSFGPAYDRVRLGQELGMFEFRRTAGGLSAGDVTRPNFSSGLGEINRQMRADVMSRTIMGQSLMQDMAEPISVGILRFGGDAGDMTVEISSLRGVSMDSASDTYHQFGLSFVDALSVSRDAAQGLVPGMSPRTRYDDLIRPGGQGGPGVPGAPGRDDAAAPRMPGDTRPVASPAFVDIQRAVLDEFVQARRDQAQTEAQTEWVLDPAIAAQRLQDDLAALRALLGSGTTVDPDDPSAFDLDSMRKRLEARRRALFPGEPPQEDAVAEPDLEGDLFVRSALRHGRRIETLTDAEQSRYRELVAEGEAMLAESRYFRAERAFSRALRIAPGHPLASVGLAHAQLGAGLYLSASLTLRTLYASNPEMIDVQYAPELRPSDERLARVREDLRQEITRERNRHTNGFLLAYVGRLLELPQDIREGLDAAAVDVPGDAMIELLRRIWLESAE